MEENSQENYKNLLLGIVPSYVELIGTAEDTFEEYSKFYESLVKHRDNTSLIILRPVLTALINYLKYSNELSVRLEVGNKFLSLLRTQENAAVFLHKWNEYISTVKLTNSSYIIENRGNIIPKEKPLSEKLENRLKYFLYIHMYQDKFSDPITIFSVRELLIGDYLDFSDHEMCNELEDTYKTLLFKISRRQYSVQQGEMHLQLKPHNL